MKRGQNAAANAAGAAAEASGAGGGKPKRAKAAAKPKAKKAKGTLVSGLLNALPDQPGPWLARCIEKWALTSPYDPSVSEAQWEQYFKERAALEWHTDCVLMKAEGGDEEAGGEEGGEAAGSAGAEPAWPFDWNKPALNDFCREFYGEPGEEAQQLSDLLRSMRDDVEATAAGCTGVEGAGALGQALAGGLFMYKYWANWDGCDYSYPRTLEFSTRLYSPCALATSLEFSYNWHCRARMSFAEHFCSSNVTLRGPGDADGAAPQAGARGAAKSLFSMEEQDSGYQERHVMGAVGLNSLGAHLLGRKGQLSVRKVLVLAAQASGLSAIKLAEESWVYREARRKHKLGAGEEDEGLGGEDSDNEQRKKSRASKYADPFEEIGEDALIFRMFGV